MQERAELKQPVVIKVNNQNVVDEVVFLSTKHTKRIHSQIEKNLIYDFKIGDEVVTLNNIPSIPILDYCEIPYMLGYNRWDKKYTDNIYIDRKSYNKFITKAELYIQLKYFDKIYEEYELKKDIDYEGSISLEELEEVYE